MKIIIHPIWILGLVLATAVVVNFCVKDQPIKAATQARIEAGGDPRPNFVVILADDLDLKLDALNYMPNLQTLMAQQGTTFTQSLVTESLCCPSRTTILRGQYVHNHQIYINGYPNGGYQKFFEIGHENSNLGSWLQNSGYNTAYLGKYLNGYPLQGSRTHVPIGWNQWIGGLGDGIYEMNEYSLNENGTVTNYGNSDSEYLTDVLSNKAVNLINQSSTNTTPFFIYLNPTAPHAPANPATRHETLFPNVQTPQSPSFNEADVSDKPADIRNRPLLTQQQINGMSGTYRNRIRSMQAVDEMIASVIQALQASGKLNNTYIVFASDNGFHIGQHRLPVGKGTAYEEDIVVPLIIRGPNVPANRTLNDYMIGNIDFAPTFADIAGVNVPSFVDGRSFKSLLTNDAPPANQWRKYFLIEQYPFSTAEVGDDFAGFVPDTARGKVNIGATEPIITAVRTTRYKYVEWFTGERELYDLQNDPYELENFYPTGDPNLIAELSSKLAALRICVGDQCKTAEDGSPSPTPTPTETPTVTPTASPMSTPTATPTPGAGLENDVSSRFEGDGIVISGDVVQMRRFAAGLDSPSIDPNEYQRADSAPRDTLGDGMINSGDVVQTRRYAAGLDPETPAGGPTGPPDVPNPLISIFENVYRYLFG
ncbi:MAG: sulfatase-like hydrolase/transferase [Pyrinomonadaceae bacterium]